LPPRSGQATVLLKQGGFTRFANLRGGMLAWNKRPSAKSEISKSLARFL